MCKKYSINPNNYKDYEKYLKWLSVKPYNPYVDPDAKKSVPEFYKSLSCFLNKRENEFKDKLKGQYEYYFDVNDKEAYGILVMENDKKVFYLKSDQFGFSRPSEDQKYIYDIYLLKSDDKEKAIKNIVEWISSTRTIGGSFLWPMEKSTKNNVIWDENPEYNIISGGSKYGDVRYYLQDRVDLKLFEVKDYYNSNSDKNSILYSHILKWPNMVTWLDHFKNFDTYIDFFGFRINNNKDSFVNDDNDIVNIFSKDENSVLLDESFNIGNYKNSEFKKCHIYNDEQKDYLSRIEQMLNTLSKMVINRSKWMEKEILCK